MAFFMYNDKEVMNMIYVTGDTHGNQFKWLEQIDPILKEGDIIIVCGDFGIGFFQQKYSSEESFYDFISEQPYTNVIKLIMLEFKSDDISADILF